MAYQNSDLVNGNDLLLYIYSGSTAQPVAFGTSASLQVDGATISANNKMACRFAQNLLGNCSYTVSSDSLYTDTDAHYSFDDMLASMVAGETVKWALAKATSASTSACTSATYAIDSTEIVAAGEAIITSLSLNAGLDEVASCSITLTGTGDIKQSSPV